MVTLSRKKAEVKGSKCTSPRAMNQQNRTPRIAGRGHLGALMVIALVIVTLYMAFAFPYTLLHLKQTETTEIKAVIIVARGGEKSPNPDSYFTGEEPPEELNSIGYDQLTNQGKERMFSLGKFLKLRYYHTLLNGNPRKIYIRSSDADRCLESSEALLAGLNPPKSRWLWSATNELNNWQPKAIHSALGNSDDLLSEEHNCFRLDQATLRWKNSTKYQQLLNEFRHDLQTLRSNTGLDFEDDLEMLAELEDSLATRKAYNDNIPPWYTNTFANRLAHITDVTSESRYNSANTQRLYVGRLLHEISENVNTKIRLHQLSLASAPLDQSGELLDGASQDVEHADQDIARLRQQRQQEQQKLRQQSRLKFQNAPNFYIYMTHKNRLAALLNSLQIYTSQPHFGSILLIELHYDPINQVYFLRLFTVSPTKPDIFPEPLRVNPVACADSGECSPQQFEQNIRHLMLDKLSWQEACTSGVLPILPPPTTMAPRPFPFPTTASTPTITDSTTMSKLEEKLDETLIVGPTDAKPDQLNPVQDATLPVPSEPSDNQITEATTSVTTSLPSRPPETTTIDTLSMTTQVHPTTEMSKLADPSQVQDNEITQSGQIAQRPQPGKTHDIYYPAPESFVSFNQI